MTSYESRVRGVESYFRGVLAHFERNGLALQEDGGSVFLVESQSGGRLRVGTVGFISVKGAVLQGFPHDEYPFYTFLAPAYLFSRIFRSFDAFSRWDDAYLGALVDPGYSVGFSLSDWYDKDVVRDRVAEVVWRRYALSVESVVLAAPGRGLYLLGMR